MKYYLQTDPRWKNKTYYNGYTFGKLGCFVTSLAMLVEKEPPVVATILRQNGCFDKYGLLNSECAAKALGLFYGGKTTKRPNYTCIAETLYYDKASTQEKEQHFFTITPGIKIYDPLGTNIKYPIKSYRLFKAKGESMKYCAKYVKEKGKPTIYIYEVKYGKGYLYPIASSAADLCKGMPIQEFRNLSKYGKRIVLGERGKDCPPCPAPKECPPCPDIPAVPDEPVSISNPPASTDVNQKEIINIWIKLKEAWKKIKDYLNKPM